MSKESKTEETSLRVVLLEQKQNLRLIKMLSG